MKDHSAVCSETAQNHVGHVALHGLAHRTVKKIRLFKFYLQFYPLHCYSTKHSYPEHNYLRLIFRRGGHGIRSACVMATMCGHNISGSYTCSHHFQYRETWPSRLFSIPLIKPWGCKFISLPITYCHTAVWFIRKMKTEANSNGVNFLLHWMRSTSASLLLGAYSMRLNLNNFVRWPLLDYLLPMLRTPFMTCLLWWSYCKVPRYWSYHIVMFLLLKPGQKEILVVFPLNSTCLKRAFTLLWLLLCKW